jgi:hypothetical protein
MRFYKLWEIVAAQNTPWIGILNSYGAITGIPDEGGRNHEDIWPTQEKRWRYRPGSGMVTLWWDADIEEKDHIEQWITQHGGKVNSFIKAFG